jgi:hypothetical protein
MTGFSYTPPAATSQSLTTTSLTPVVYNGTAYVAAQADADTKCADLVLLSDGSRTESGKVTWTGHGLTVGSYYYLSQTTPGALTPTRPTAGLLQQILFVEDINTIHVDIEPAGTVDVAASVADISWTEVVPGGGWSNGDTTFRTTLGYKKVNGIVYLKGWVTGGGTNGDVLMTLPVGIRPTGLGTKQLELNAGGDPGRGRLVISGVGSVHVYTTGGGTSLLTLDGLCFAVDY